MLPIVKLSTATAEFSMKISKSLNAAGVARFIGSYYGCTKGIARRIKSSSDFVVGFHTLESGSLTAATEEDLMARFHRIVQSHGEILD